MGPALAVALYSCSARRSVMSRKATAICHSCHRSVGSVTISGDCTASSATEPIAESMAVWARISSSRLTRSNAEGSTRSSR